MNILFATFHPADSHVFKYVASELQSKGNNILFTVVEKEGIISAILESYGFRVKKIGKSRKSIPGKLLNVLLIDIRLFIECLWFKPDLMVSPTTPYTGHISKILGIRLISWGDTETAVLNLKLSLPFIDCLLLPDCYYKKAENEKIIFFKGYKETAYLLPRYFKPDISVLEKLGLKDSDKIILIRFSALNAMHDIGIISGIEKNSEMILHYVRELSNYAKVLFSCTEKMPGSEFDNYKLKISPSDYLHLLSFCSIYIGEGTTTASEAGVLGVPWIALRSQPLGYLEDQEKNYNLGFRTDNIETAFKTAIDWIQRDDLKMEWAHKRRHLFKNKIDFTSFLIWFLENYPESKQIMKKNPHFQDRFYID